MDGHTRTKVQYSGADGRMNEVLRRHAIGEVAHLLHANVELVRWRRLMKHVSVFIANHDGLTRGSEPTHSVRIIERIFSYDLVNLEDQGLGYRFVL
jgi:hypothetical protein